MWTWLDTRKGFQHQPTALRKMASIYMGCQTNEPCSQIHQCETQVHRETPKKIKLGFFKLHPTPTVTGELAPFIWTKGSGCSKPSNHSNIGLRVFLRKNYVKITPFYGLFTQIYGLFTGYGFFTGQIIPKTWFWATLPDPSNCRCTLPRCNWLEFSQHG